MRKQQKFLIAVLCLAAVVAIATFLTGDPEPRYAGHRLSYWTSFYVDPSNDPERYSCDPRADQAVRCIGTNALPYLVRWFGTPLTPRVRMLDELYRHLPNPVSHAPFVRSMFDSNTDRDRTERGFLGLLALGSQAAPAIPDLVRIRDKTNSFILSAHAEYLLEVIANPARRDVP